jgi:hypothetical protein
MAHRDAREEKWRGTKRMEWVTSKRHMTAEHRLARAVQTLQSDVHSSPASSRPNWRPCRFKWTHPFRRKTKSGFCACAITFQTQSTQLSLACKAERDFLFYTLVQTGPGAHPAYCTMGNGVSSRGWSGQGVALTTHHPLAPRLRISSDIPLRPLHVSMACYREAFAFTYTELENRWQTTKIRLSASRAQVKQILPAVTLSVAGAS